jgi:enoyl-CoA hydratase
MSEVLYDLKDGIAVITLNRPEKHNAMNTPMRDGLFEAFNRFEADPTARVAIFTAAGDKTFCSGRDLRDPVQAGMTTIKRDYLPIIGEAIKLTKPVIAAINGPAIALGFIFAQMCDMVVCSSKTTFAVTEVKMGRGVAWAAPLAAMVPRKVASELLLTSMPITAQRAYEIGLVNHVVPPEQVMAKATELAQAIVASGPIAVRVARKVIEATFELPLSQAYDKAYEMTQEVYDSEDAKEGVRAFVEKRAPRWTGR